MAVTRLSIDSVEELRKEKSKAELQAENEQFQTKIELLEGCVNKVQWLPGLIKALGGSV